MTKINIITSNSNKLRELKVVFPSKLKLEMTTLNLDEIQSLDRAEIIRYKLRQAYTELHEPVIVEDVSAELENLNGLPGPFIKFFEQKLGTDALYKLSYEGAKVKIICTMGYLDGENEIVVEGIVNGTVVAPRGEDDFGFDIVIVPDGYTQTFAEMGKEKKNLISHRRKAANQLLEQLLINNIL